MGDVVPAPSLRELSSECETEGVYFGERKNSKITESITADGKPSARSNHRTTLPQSRPKGVTAPSEREPGRGAYHSMYHSETARVRAIFIAPTKAQEPFPFTIQRGTLPQSRPLGVPAPSGREPGMGRTIQRAARKPWGWRAIFIAPTKLRGFYILPFGGKMGVEFLGRVWYNSFGNRCRISSLVEWSLPKPQRRVRFPYPAPQKALASAGAFLIRKIRFFVEFSEFFGIIMEIPPPMEDMLWMR